MTLQHQPPIPTMSEYVLAPLHPPVRDLRPDIQEACRQALLDAGVEPVDQGATGSTEESWLVAMLVISMCVLGAVMLLWLVGGAR